MESEDISVLGFLSQRFADTGTRNWPEKTVEWFLVYLLTEFAVAPHNIRQGRNAMSLTFAYQQIVDNLVSRNSPRTIALLTVGITNRNPAGMTRLSGTSRLLLSETFSHALMS